VSGFLTGKICFAQAKRACAQRRATSENALETSDLDRRMDREQDWG
jgi:hypothetical protein